MSGAAYFSPAPPPSLHPESRGAHGAQQRTVECSLSVTGDDMHHSDEDVRSVDTADYVLETEADLADDRLKPLPSRLKYDDKCAWTRNSFGAL